MNSNTDLRDYYEAKFQWRSFAVGVLLFIFTVVGVFGLINDGLSGIRLTLIFGSFLLFVVSFWNFFRVRSRRKIGHP